MCDMQAVFTPHLQASHPFTIVQIVQVPASEPCSSAPRGKYLQTVLVPPVGLLAGILIKWSMLYMANTVYSMNVTYDACASNVGVLESPLRENCRFALLCLYCSVLHSLLSSSWNPASAFASDT